MDSGKTGGKMRGKGKELRGVLKAKKTGGLRCKRDLEKIILLKE